MAVSRDSVDNLRDIFNDEDENNGVPDLEEGEYTPRSQSSPLHVRFAQQREARKEMERSMHGTIYDDSYKTLEIRRRTDINRIINLTTKCDGTQPDNVRIWVEEMEIVEKQCYRDISATAMMEVVTNTVTGDMRKAVERFITDCAENQVIKRLEVPWDEVRQFITSNYLSLDEEAYRRDVVKRAKRTAFETVPVFNRRFRDLAEKAFTVVYRNKDQNDLLIECYLKGVNDEKLVREVLKACNGHPRDINQVMTLAMEQAHTDYQVERIVGEDAATPSIAAVSTTKNDTMMEKMMSMQEKMMTRLAKLEAKMEPKEGSGTYVKRKTGTKEAWTKNGKPAFKDGKPLCFNCELYGHISRECPQKKRQAVAKVSLVSHTPPDESDSEGPVGMAGNE